MAIRDQYRVKLTNGNEITVSATRQGGIVELSTDEEFFVVRELTKAGLEVRTVHVAKASVESVTYTNG